MAENEFDLVVIGGGPGGYVCAIRAAQLGMKVACVEKRPTLGGTCLNVGCIPSKALLHASELYSHASHDFAKYGIEVKGLKVNLGEMLSYKDKVVTDLTKGIEGLFRKNKVTRLTGHATIEAAGIVVIDGKEKIRTKNIVIATGSQVVNLPGVEIDEKSIISSTGALSLSTIPQKMIVIGGGYIGLEMGSVWQRLGSEVTVVEFLDKIVPTMDGEVGKQFQKALAKQGMEFRLSTKVSKAEKKGSKVILTIEPASGGKAETMEADVVLVAIGRRAYTDNLGLDKVGITTDKAGRIGVDKHFATNIPGIYAIGDVIAGPMLAHKAEEEGVAVAELLAGQAGHVNYDVIPGVVYTYPEVASVGKTEEELKAAGTEYKVGKFPFMANSRARAIGETEGMVKILACAKTDKVLGVHIIAPDAGTIIHEVVSAMEYQASAEDIARTCHAHPTLNEAVKEAALAVDGRAIHI
jgi:dihydrolipoamide dehydrogenase